MAGLGLMMRRGAINSTVKPTMRDSLIAMYTFEGRSNDDENREIVYPVIGGGYIDLSAFGNAWGTGDKYTTTGFYNNQLCCYANTYGKIFLPKTISEEFTIIVQRRASNVSPVGTTQIGSIGYNDSSSSPILIEYKPTINDAEMISAAQQLQYVPRITGNGFAWLTPTHYNNRPLTATRDVEVQGTNTLLIGKARPGVGGSSFTRFMITSIHIFDKTFTPEEIEKFIQEYILPSYVLP